MKCLCFSDSHGYTSGIRRALSAHPDSEVVFFLGDGLCDIEPIISENQNRAWIFVRGNCDIRREINSIEAKIVESITLEGKKITLTHGDRYGAKHGHGELLALAKRTGSDIILFGHTHTPHESYNSDMGVYLFNPGSISGGYSSPKSYGIITLTAGGVLFSHAFYL